MYRMHTCVASNCMHVVHSGGFGFGGGLGYTYLNPLNPIYVNLNLSLFKVTYQLLGVMVQLLIAMALTKPLGVQNYVNYPN